MKKSTEPEILTKKMAMLGSIECIKIMADAMRVTVLQAPSRVDTEKVQIFIEGIIGYVKMLKNILETYDEEMGSKQKLAPLPLSSLEYSLEEELLDSPLDDLKLNDILDLFKITKKPPSGSNDGGDKN